LIPEQVWDAADLPERSLYCGWPTYSARPLVWAHAEHVKLLRSIRDGRVFDSPAQPHERYLVKGTRARFTLWSLRNRLRFVAEDQHLRLQTEQPARVRFSWDGWQTARDENCRPTGLDAWVLDLPLEGSAIEFTFLWTGSGQWQGEDFRVEVARRDSSGRLLAGRPGACRELPRD
jgi:glucoamylase